MYLDLIKNASLLIALANIYSMLARIRADNKRGTKVLMGALFGVVAIVGMLLPFNYAPGVIYDGRSIILALAGLFGGGTTAAVSILIAGAYRASLGGNGVWAGLATIVSCAIVGLAFRRLLKKTSRELHRPGTLCDWRCRSSCHAGLPIARAALAHWRNHPQANLAPGPAHLSGCDLVDRPAF